MLKTAISDGNRGFFMPESYRNTIWLGNLDFRIIEE